MHAHGAHVGHVDAGDAVLVEELAVLRRSGNRKTAELLGCLAYLVEALAAAIVRIRNAGTPFNNPKLSAALFTDEVLKNKRNTEAVEIGTSSLVVARVVESNPALLRPFADVQVPLIRRLAREEAINLAKQDGEAKLAALKAGKGEVKFPPLLAVSRAAPGGLQAPVIDAAMRANPKTLPTYAGYADPSGSFTLIQVARVIDAPLPDEAKFNATRTRLQQSLGQNELVSMLAQMRKENDVSIAKGAIDKKTDK